MECLIELNLEFDCILLSHCYTYSTSIVLRIQVCTLRHNERIEFMHLEELKEPSVKSIDKEEGIEW